MIPLGEGAKKYMADAAVVVARGLRNPEWSPTLFELDATRLVIAFDRSTHDASQDGPAGERATIAYGELRGRLIALVAAGLPHVTTEAP